ncbi:MAG: S-methyl-5'-thioadenosine phosphorylase [Vicinamibacteria bacterium]|nr:S-methyl-5'-thioadenosine phosphorylase [Vicinamibacteria bacterium]
MDDKAEIGIIGGSGLYDMEGLTDVREVAVATPFGDPSDTFVIGTLHGKRVAFLPRHGRGHRLLPSELNFRANLWALKSLGVKWILSVSAVGSLQEQYVPGHVVLPDQFVDRTSQRKSTFFGDGLVGHVAFARPFCKNLAPLFAQAARDAGATVHEGGSYVCIEGPQFSTLAESRLYRSWGMDLVGMTNLQEAKLAREAEICYATLALVTDYDCWHPDHDAVTVDAVLAILKQNALTAKRTLANAVARLPIARDCECESALRFALMTAPERVPEEIKRKLAPIVGRYIP